MVVGRTARGRPPHARCRDEGAACGVIVAPTQVRAALWPPRDARAQAMSVFTALRRRAAGCIKYRSRTPLTALPHFGEPCFTERHRRRKRKSRRNLHCWSLVIGDGLCRRARERHLRTAALGVPPLSLSLFLYQGVHACRVCCSSCLCRFVASPLPPCSPPCHASRFSARGGGPLSPAPSSRFVCPKPRIPH